MTDLYMVTTRAGGKITKVFKLKEKAKEYYDNNSRFNATITKIIPFIFNKHIYYYSIGNCIAVYNQNYEFLTKISTLDKNNYKIEDICKSLDEWLNEPLPY